MKVAPWELEARDDADYWMREAAFANKVEREVEATLKTIAEKQAEFNAKK